MHDTQCRVAIPLGIGDDANGKEITYASTEGSVAYLYRIPADGSASPQVLRKGSFMHPNCWSPDGHLAFMTLERGLPFLAVTRDVSTGGLCMLHTRPAPASKLFVEIERPNDTPLDVVLNVRRNRRVGLFFEIAGDFITVDDEALAAAKARLATRRPGSN